MTYDTHIKNVPFQFQPVFFPNKLKVTNFRKPSANVDTNILILMRIKTVDVPSESIRQ